MEMNIRDHWDRLSPATRRWLTDNPGCLILPRTLREKIRSETGIGAEVDRHGQATLSREDLDFLRSRTEGTRTPPPEHRFFDATQPGPGA
ncbi:hypothetical protein [Arthrobacter sp. UYCu712]|uniref:hypothetical protein n=1 Tax=Arthrobacter sp. UYCu712 TaxID=3156340 RepID=UPI003395F9EE